MNTQRQEFKLKISLLIILLLVVALLQPGSVSAAATTITLSQSFPVNIPVYIPCAAGGTGEYVLLSGNLHDLFSLTLDSKGGFHLTYLDNPQGITGVGWTTGAKYQGTGQTGGTLNGSVGYEETYVNNFRMIGQGPGNNFMVHDTYHITFNANGTLTVYVDNYSAVCI